MTHVLPVPDSVHALETVSLTKHYPVRGRWGGTRKAGVVQAVDDVSIRIPHGTTCGLVGESGSGKSTLGRLIMRLVEPTSGRVLLEGDDISTIKGRALRRRRQHLQVVFQDPFSSFDPQASIRNSLRESIAVLGRQRRGAMDERAAELLSIVGLDAAYLDRHPNQLSGGQLQRVAIARALAVEPKVLVLDEPTSALDVSTQAHVVNLLREIQEQRGVTFLFIAHDLSVVRQVSDRVAVMYLGRVVEEGPVDAVFGAASHPYTSALLSAVPLPAPEAQRRQRRIVLQGEVPSAIDPPRGCRFHTRCPFAMHICEESEPKPFTTQQGVTTYCHLHTTGPTLGGAAVAQLEPGAWIPVAVPAVRYVTQL